MPKLHIFAGASGLARKQAKLLIKDLQNPMITSLPWWEAFTPSRTLLEDLEVISQKVDAALLVFSPDFPATIRAKQRRDSESERDV